MQRLAFQLRACVLFLIAVVAPGCTTSKPPPNEHAELDNVAECFHEAVTVLQATPNTPDELGAFMRKAKAGVAISGRRSKFANFSELRWNDDETLLVTKSGDPIHYRFIDAGEDLYADGSVLLSEYEFFVRGAEYCSRTTIELSLRESDAIKQ